VVYLHGTQAQVFREKRFQLVDEAVKTKMSEVSFGPGRVIAA
jgi:hypothetical protein